MKIKEIMTQNPEVVRFDDSVKSAAQVMKNLNIGAVPVVDGSDAVGIVTDRDIAVRLVADGKDPQTASVGDIMTRNVVTCTDDLDVGEAVGIMKDKQVRRLLVRDGQGKIVGMVALGDLAVRTQSEEGGETLHEISKPAQPER